MWWIDSTVYLYARINLNILVVIVAQLAVINKGCPSLTGFPLVFASPFVYTIKGKL